MKKEEEFDDDIYITKIKNTRHINLSGLLHDKQKPVCLICFKKKPTYAHHIIPKRIKAKNNPLKELRLNVCRSCHIKLHPENKYAEALKLMLTFHIDSANGDAKHLTLFRKIEKKLSSTGNFRLEDPNFKPNTIKDAPPNQY